MLWLSAWLGALLILGCSRPAHGRASLGCIFEVNLCDGDEECFDDKVLGRCFNPLLKRPSQMRTYQWLSVNDMVMLEEQIKILFNLGYYWDDMFVQCVLDTMLEDITDGGYKFDYARCEKYDEPRKQAENNEVEALGGEDEATIRFTPSDPGSQFADEVFYPQPGLRKPSQMDILTSALTEGMRRRAMPAVSKKSEPPLSGATNRAMRRSDRTLPSTRELLSLQDLDRFAAEYNTPQRFREGLESRDDENNPALANLALSLLAQRGDTADPSLHLFSAHYNTPTTFRQGLEYRGDLSDLSGLADLADLAEPVPRVMDGDGPEELDTPLILEDMWDEEAAGYPAGYPVGYPPGDLPGDPPGPRGFSKLYNTPDSFRAGLETRDVEEEAEPELWMEQPRAMEYGGPQDRPLERLEEETVFIRPSRRGGADEEVPERMSAGQPEQEEQLLQQQQAAAPPPAPDQPNQADQTMKELSHLLQEYNKDGVPAEIQAEEDEVDRAPGRAYTEGGLVFLPDQQTDRPETLDGRSLDALLKEWRGFERRERLDVKKPGPSYNVNNYYFQRDHEEKRNDKAEARETNEVTNVVQGEPRFEAIHASPPMSSQHKKQPGYPDKDMDESDTPRDPNVVSVKFKNGISTWADGETLINVLATTLKQMPSAFGMRRVSMNDAVSFKVDPATATLNASEVARQIMEKKDEIKKRMSVDIQSATSGKPLVQMAPRAGWQSDGLILGTVVAGVTLSAAVISAVTYYVVRRVQMSRDKLRGMTAPDTEASKDYQDLCRARMAKKAEAERAAEARGDGHVDQRLASLSRESEGSNNSPSSRSSTSSWTEEPALTNMDISTGHMVLAYMEDHLKNKDRLEQEWQGLCAYEAEPCESTVAQKPENVKKNRYYPHVLPYDHSRVVLNELANATGSDYINASTITDHDPRNPAYLATQGPLPQTAADLWQLVWEQGSVVMVMLSRLTENGTAMCHRYWPEEGSELYHIYEVHLVSEHIWCDDYLVRSFYLKNLKTGETRTVTQFHFLSWPDHGVPPSTKPLLDFRRKVNKSYRGRSCPIVVHCSDGAGRTGTYCLIDMVLNRMAKGAKEIDIAATLEHIRDQRANMVESREQFEFCLQAVADEVHAILKALPAQPTPPPTAVVPPQPPSPAPQPTKEQPKKKT